ncbi:P44/Msp2 family outer membrane protein [Wolbachia endosymbiont (group E) of Neria commutata]|uniref:P44/Msp2 family outer membrane protein n=1 Tax=Wolbachia endosymbiont (group E) of Neria commutata TaxID=3066149 RepID=UPI003132C028
MRVKNLIALFLFANTPFFAFGKNIDVKHNYYASARYQHIVSHNTNEVWKEFYKQVDTDKEMTKYKFESLSDALTRDINFVGSAAIGYYFGNSRIEFEYINTKLNLHTHSDKFKDKKSLFNQSNSDNKFIENDDNFRVFQKRFSGRYYYDIRESKRFHTGMINLYYDLNINSTYFTPYVGVGAGVTFGHNELFFVNKDMFFLDSSSNDKEIKVETQNVINYQAKLGVNYNFNLETKISAGYVYFGRVNSAMPHFVRHNIEIGLSFNF